MSLDDKLPNFLIQNDAIVLLGRFCFSLIFFASGITHFTDMPGYVRLMHESIPFREFWVLISGVVELAGAIMILFDRSARLGAWLIFIFLVPVTITVHGVLMVTADNPEASGIQLSFFLKGIAMAGGALLITQFGVRRHAS